MAWLKQSALLGLCKFFIVLSAFAGPIGAIAAPYAAYVMDARTGEVLHSHNANTRLHPASLTKMMTLYIAFEAIEKGELSLNQKITISKNAAAEPASKLGLKSGQRIALKYLIRAAAVKSANDAATAIGEAISGSEARFARRMNRTAKALGMSRTTFKNANGLTEKGHMSTAHDMTILGRHMLFDYPQYYNLFSRKSTNAGMREVANTNRKFLAAYKGADGIKTGYTRAAGFNLVASAKRGNERIIATVFGGKSTASRNAQVAKLLDLGFRRAPSHARTKKPKMPKYNGSEQVVRTKTIRVNVAVKASLRPKLRPTQVAHDANAINDSIVLAALTTEATQKPQETKAKRVIDLTQAPKPQAQAEENFTQTQTLAAVSLRPQLRPADLKAPDRNNMTVTLTRESLTEEGSWGVNLGRYRSRNKAERVLVKIALAEGDTLSHASRKIISTSRGFEANFYGMTRKNAEMTCLRMSQRNEHCMMIAAN